MRDIEPTTQVVVLFEGRTGCNEQRGCVSMTRPCSDMKRRFSTAAMVDDIGRLVSRCALRNICAFRQQQADTRPISNRSKMMERCPTIELVI